MSTPELTREQKDIVSIQLLRCLACFAVVLIHYNILYLRLSGLKDQKLILIPFGAGVDLFFIISGFVMCHTTRSSFGRPWSPISFIAKRIFRIVPLYWLITFLTVPMVGSFDLPHLLASLFFIPNYTTSVGPVLGVGWTLNYEMFFYVVFAVALFLPNRRIGLATILATLVVLVVLGQRLRPAPPLEAWTNPLLFEFGTGILLALLYENRGARLPVYVALTIIIVGVWLSTLTPIVPQQGPTRWITMGLPMLLVAVGTILGRWETAGPRMSKVINVLGGASYALYLVHTPICTVIVQHWHGALNALPMPEVFFFGILLSVLLSVALHLYLELPLIRILRRVFLGPPQPRAVVVEST